MDFKLTIEIPLFLTYFAFLVTDSLNTNLIIYRACYVTMGIDQSNCSLLGKGDTSNVTKSLEEKVQPTADVISMVKTLVDSSFSVVLCLFVGSWSDRFGRKPVVVLNLLGYVLMNLVMVGFAALENLSPWLMMTCSIPVILTGGGASFLTVLLAYLSDVTTESDRGFRMGVFEVTLALAILIGNSTSSYIFNATSYVAVYALAALSCLLAMAYTIAYLPESLDVREDTGRIKGFFQIRNLTGMFHTSFRPRPGSTRTIILLIALSLGILMAVTNGDISVTFLFMREKFNWNLQQYTLFSGISSFLWISSILFNVYVIHHRLHVTESKLMSVGFVALAVAALIQGLAKVDWLIYFAALIRLPSGGLNSMGRSLMSKLVDADERGKIFGVSNLLLNVIGLFGAPIYTTLYNNTIKTDPGIFNFLTSTFHGLNLLLIGLIIFLEKKERTYTNLQDEPTHIEASDATS